MWNIFVNSKNMCPIFLHINKSMLYEECDGMKKKKRLIPIVVFALLWFSVIGCYFLYDNLFPKAETVKCPKIENISSISLIQNDDTSVKVETENFDEFIKNISSAEPTREMSLNEYPRVENYYIIKVDTSVREYQYFIYVENEQIYMESPYEGVYKTNQKFLDLVTEYFKE